MNYFVCLHIKEPIPTAGLHGDIGLIAVDHTPVAILFFPHGVDDAELGIIDGGDQFAGMVIFIALPHRHHKFVANGQDGFDGFGAGIIQFLAVSYKRESAYFHMVSYWLNCRL